MGFYLGFLYNGVAKYINAGLSSMRCVRDLEQFQSTEEISGILGCTLHNSKTLR